MIRSLADLKAGLDRFGKGDFEQRIAVTSRDEIEDIAAQANQMAASLERFATALKLSNQELEAFSYSVAHDLRAPLRGINGFSKLLLEDWGDKLDDEAKDYLHRIAAAAERMAQLIDALLTLSRVTRAKLHHENVDLASLADGVMSQLRQSEPDRVVDFVVERDVSALGDPLLLRAVLENLLGNAWKFTSGREGAHIVLGAEPMGDSRVYYVRDNGAGFDMAYADKLFTPFQRLPSTEEFAGTGIGLATVQRIVHRHGGRIWAEGGVGRGATFRFTLPRPSERTIS